MPPQRFYIHRKGATDACALTGTKNEPRLPSADALDDWRFWMQISRFQDENGEFGFEMKAAAEDINARGYSLFTGSLKLLAPRVRTQPLPPSQERSPDG
jgi:hypothetical protein